MGCLRASHAPRFSPPRDRKLTWERATNKLYPPPLHHHTHTHTHTHICTHTRAHTHTGQATWEEGSTTPSQYTHTHRAGVNNTHHNTHTQRQTYWLWSHLRQEFQTHTIRGDITVLTERAPCVCVCVCTRVQTFMCDTADISKL